MSEQNLRKGDWIQVYSGGKFFPLDAREEDVHIGDIAHALSNLCRFTGHVKQFYSVAEHCCHVFDILPAELRLEGLLHDASEAYLCDMPRPLKTSGDFAKGYLQAEQDLMQVIARRFNFFFPLPYLVHEADNTLLMAEAKQLMSPLCPDWMGISALAFQFAPMGCWEPTRAKEEFLMRYALCRRG